MQRKCRCGTAGKATAEEAQAAGRGRGRYVGVLSVTSRSKRPGLLRAMSVSCTLSSDGPASAALKLANTPHSRISVLPYHCRLITGMVPTGSFQNPRSRNLGPQNKPTNIPKPIQTYYTIKMGDKGSSTNVVGFTSSGRYHDARRLLLCAIHERQ